MSDVEMETLEAEIKETQERLSSLRKEYKEKKYASLKMAMEAKSIVNTVHDSIVIDVHPEEKNAVIGVIDKTNKELSSLISSRWGISFNVPLLLEAKIGYNWLDTKDVS